MTVAAPTTVHSTPSLPSQVTALTTATSVALPAIRPLISAAAPWSADSSGAHCRRTRTRRMAKTSAATVTMTSGARLRRRRSRVSPERAVELPAVRRFTFTRPRSYFPPASFAQPVDTEDGQAQRGQHHQELTQRLISQREHRLVDAARLR